MKLIRICINVLLGISNTVRKDYFKPDSLAALQRTGWTDGLRCSFGALGRWISDNKVIFPSKFNEALGLCVLIQRDITSIPVWFLSSSAQL